MQHFIFSSTAATYGIPDGCRSPRTTPTEPINPYGWSKLMTERMLRDTAAAHPLNYCALRYFNVAGADPQGRAGQSTAGATHLIKVAVEAALGKRDESTVFGTDYDTPDGTGVRDYIHVSDLAAAHVARARAADRRARPRACTMNCGYGRGFSVLEVLDAVDRVTNLQIERRHGGAPRGRSRRARSPTTRRILATLPGGRSTTISTRSSPTRSRGSASWRSALNPRRISRGRGTRERKEVTASRWSGIHSAVGNPTPSLVLTFVRIEGRMLDPLTEYNYSGITFMFAALPALADPTRFQIVDLLGAGERSPGRSSGPDVSQPSASKHLKVLREAGLVRMRKDRQRRLYAIDPGPLAK